MLIPAFVVFAIINALLPFALSNRLTECYQPTAQEYQIIKSFSLLILGMFLASLATLNFSLALFVGLLASPLSFTRPFADSAPARAVFVVLLNVMAPTTVAVACALYWHVGVGTVLREAAFAWDVYGMYSSLVVWCVWWPAWLAGTAVVLGRPRL